MALGLNEAPSYRDPPANVGPANRARVTAQYEAARDRTYAGMKRRAPGFGATVVRLDPGRRIKP